MRYLAFLALFLVLLAACQPVMPATEMRTTSPEPMPPSVSAEPSAPAPDGEPALTAGFKPTGKLLVDATTQYIEYNQADFDAARAAGKIVYLEFWAAWCPFCQRLEPLIRESIANLDDPGVVAFRVNYDNSADLQKKYNVIYQHTHIVLKTDGSVSWKSLDTNWNDELFRSEIQKAKGG
ncbi:thioredoxin family protein [Candidatus Woesearchaeota archaeon]|nr:thioredoxin family protein [Candidatus Woesearchaeota archaeon]